MQEKTKASYDAQVKASVEALLSQAWNGDVCVGERETLREDKCFRYQVERGPSGSPVTVIVKKARRENSCPIDPDALAPNPAHRFLDEWASLAFIKAIAPGE